MKKKTTADSLSALVRQTEQALERAHAAWKAAEAAHLAAQDALELFQKKEA